MKTILFLLILTNSQLFVAWAQQNDTACNDWSKKHVRLTKHLEYFNFSVAIVEFAHFDELNVKCVNLKFENLKRLQFKALASSLLPTNSSFANLLLTFKFETTDSSVSIRNLKVFLLKRNTNFVFNMEIYHLELNDIEFDFYFNVTQIVTKETCLMEKFKFVNFLDTTYSLMMGKGTVI